MNTDEPLPTRASLLDRLKDAGDDASWEEFHRTYRGLLVGVARRAGLNEHDADEAVQEILITAVRKLPEFRYEPGKDSFKGWLLQIARWKIADQFRQRGAKSASAVGEIDVQGEGDSTSSGHAAQRSVSFPVPAQLPDSAQDFDSIWNAEWERYLLAQALARVKRRANPDHYAIYHLHVIEERPVAEVRRTLGVSTAQVYLAKHRVGAVVKRELRRLRNGGG